MKRILLLVCFCCAFTLAQAQYSLRLVVTEVGAKKLDDIYVTGSFNNWNPGEDKYKLKPFGPTRRAIVLKDLPAGKYEFKFTRGSLDKVETTAKGEDISNRTIELNNDESVNVTIPGWKDDYPDKPRPFTATPQVHLLDSAFNMPQLNRTRRIWIYLPKSYEGLKGKSYPVLYMHDGQKLFNENTGNSDEWGIDEYLDSVQKAGGKECIVVGIDNGGDKRNVEYNPYNNQKYGAGEGKQYVDFIAQTLKPYIDSKYRTQKDAAHTWIAGSSLGGLISLYAVMQYPTVFGAVGVFSPAFWIAPDLTTDLTNTKWQVQPRFYFYAGGKESDEMVPDMDKVIGVIEKKSQYDLRRSYFPLGQHNEKYWRKEFGDFYKWLAK
ncbi:alpha-glucosidase [Filimonas lacunae]|uniref:Alpha-glucosidase n=1 Tax=Filimonas lacunae TaxID=477680 RepID=A0A173MK93_9BACT|nr:alpha/beta hydrolase-fold protein [Filimonas lacunae]BAV07889.1 alpha-dextrin endo-1,6-alpha-glucosidase [Filimonas lacunae]SIT06054.1 alpha-glucosidase [Filimonas lacunae]